MAELEYKQKSFVGINDDGHELYSRVCECLVQKGFTLLEQLNYSYIRNDGSFVNLEPDCRKGCKLNIHIATPANTGFLEEICKDFPEFDKEGNREGKIL